MYTTVHLLDTYFSSHLSFYYIYNCSTSFLVYLFLIHLSGFSSFTISLRCQAIFQHKSPFCSTTLAIFSNFAYIPTAGGFGILLGRFTLRFVFSLFHRRFWNTFGYIYIQVRQNSFSLLT
ncbi:hypothetical protein LXL04_013450 [Taraxacum kok-saghyz]